MNDDLLHYYNRELSYVRQLGQQFAQANPDVAPQLGMDSGAGAGDPYVERLIEAFAFINARTRKKLDDDFPELVDAMLGVLYPHYQAPVPSMAIVQFELDPDQGDMAAGYPIPRGAALETEEVDGQPCFYQTCYDLTLYPIRVTGAGIDPLTLAPPIPDQAKACAVLRMDMATFSEEVGWDKMGLDSLRVFLAGDTAYTHAMYELLFNHVVQVVLTDGRPTSEPIVLEPDCLRPVGFGKNEGMLAYSSRSFHGYRVLTEYFACPEKFLFFEVTGLSPKVRSRIGHKAQLLFYIDRQNDDLAGKVNGEMFRLGCTPIVNLFRKQADPFRLTHQQSQYPLVPDARRQRAMEVYSVEQVSAVDPDGRVEEIQPFYSVQHSVDRAHQRTYWYASRRHADPIDGVIDPGTDVDLTFVDLGFQLAAPADRTIQVQTICLNRDLPGRLEFGGGHPRMRLSKGGPIVPVRCLTIPTPTRRPPLKAAAMWRLISHLSLNHLSLVGGEDGAMALREMLMLYQFAGKPEHMAKVHGIAEVHSRRTTARVGPHGAAGFCRGTEVTIAFDPDRFADQGLFLFATVMERFLGLYCSINSFSRMVAVSHPRQEVIHRWPPRAADRILL